MVEFVDVIGHQHSVVSLAYSRQNQFMMKINTKFRSLGLLEKIIVVDFITIRGRYSSSLQSLFIINRTNLSLVPLTDSDTI